MKYSLLLLYILRSFLLRTLQHLIHLQHRVQIKNFHLKIQPYKLKIAKTVFRKNRNEER